MARKPVIVVVILGVLVGAGLVIRWLAERGERGAGKSHRVRMVCSVCGAWKEDDNMKLLAPLFDGGLPADWPPDKIPSAEERSRTGRFMERHIQCARRQGGFVRVFSEDDPEFYALDPDKEER